LKNANIINESLVIKEEVKKDPIEIQTIAQRRTSLIGSSRSSSPSRVEKTVPKTICYESRFLQENEADKIIERVEKIIFGMDDILEDQPDEAEYNQDEEQKDMSSTVPFKKAFPRTSSRSSISKCESELDETPELVDALAEIIRTLSPESQKMDTIAEIRNSDSKLNILSKKSVSIPQNSDDSSDVSELSDMKDKNDLSERRKIKTQPLKSKRTNSSSPTLFRAFRSKTDSSTSSTSFYKQILANQMERTRISTEDKEKHKSKQKVPVPDEDIKKLVNESTLKGILHKRDPNGLIKGWKRRWFWLMDGRLYYSKDDAEKIPISFISLRTVSSIGVATSMKFSLFINTPCRTYHLKASNTSEMQHWINELSIAKLMMDVELSKDAHGDERFMKTGWMIKRGQIRKNWKKKILSPSRWNIVLL